MSEGGVLYGSVLMSGLERGCGGWCLSKEGGGGSGSEEY